MQQESQRMPQSSAITNVQFLGKNVRGSWENANKLFGAAFKGFPGILSFSFFLV